MQIVQERVFGSLSAQPAVMTARREALQSRSLRTDGPLTYIEGRPAWGEGFAGVIVRAISGRQVETLRDDGAPCGHRWRTHDTTFTILQNVQGRADMAHPDDSPSAQASRTIERAERMLHANGLSYHDTVRTWFYLSNILGWYSEFNEARNAAYQRLGLMPADHDARCVLPASTGIRGDSPNGAACFIDLLAVASPAGTPTVEHVRNPGQKEAYKYGSAFSRCAVIHLPDEDLLEISGTAAIDEQGRSLHPGDIRSQVRCTLEKIACLLKQARASFHDICDATVFVKRPQDVEAARQAMADHGLERLPAVWVQADVCRDDLLFEIDAEAVAVRP